jgi:hypothetical protein
MVAGVIDAVEVFNGTWLDQRYVGIAEQIADVLGVARTGGSDAHDAAELMACFTEIPGPVTSTADVVRALQQGATVPQRRRAPGARKRFRLF